MKAYVTSIGEPTTDLCVWSLERQGFEVVLLNDGTTLWNKLKKIYEMADDTFLRVDADVIANRNIKRVAMPSSVWWVQYNCFGWFSQEASPGGIQLYGKETLEHLRKRIDEAEHMDRPETFMSRLVEFHEPRRFASSDMICGVHGYMQNDYDRIYKVKAHRNQLDNYDFDWVTKVNDATRDFYNNH